MSDLVNDEVLSVPDQFDRDISDVEIPGFDEPQEDSAAAVDDQAEEIAAGVAAGSGTDPDDDPDAPEKRKPATAKPEAAVDPKAAPAAAKKLAFKAGDQTVELAEDAVTQWKVDGKQVDIPLKDLLQNYSGKVAYEKRFSEVDQVRRKVAEDITNFDRDRQRHTALITDMHKATKEGRVFDAVASMIKMSGLQVSPREYVKNLRAALIDQTKQYAEMTPEQRQLAEDKEEIEYLRSESALLRKQTEEEQAQAVFQKRVGKAIESAKTTIEEYVKQRDFLLQEGTKLGLQAAQVTPEYVAQHIGDVRRWETAREALNSVDPELAKNEKIWGQAQEMLKSNPDWTAEDVADVYRQTFAKKRAESASRKVAKSPTSTTAVASTKRGKKQNTRDDWTDFDAADAAW